MDRSTPLLFYWKNNIFSLSAQDLKIHLHWRYVDEQDGKGDDLYNNHGKHYDNILGTNETKDSRIRGKNKKTLIKKKEQSNRYDFSSSDSDDMEMCEDVSINKNSIDLDIDRLDSPILTKKKSNSNNEYIYNVGTDDISSCGYKKVKNSQDSLKEISVKLLSIETSFDPLFFDKCPVCVIGISKTGKKVKGKRKNINTAPLDFSKILLLKIGSQGELLENNSLTNKQFYLALMKEFDLETDHSDDMFHFLSNYFTLVLIDKKLTKIQMKMFHNPKHLPLSIDFPIEVSAKLDSKNLKICSIYQIPFQCASVIIFKDNETFSTIYISPKILKSDDCVGKPTVESMCENYETVKIPIGHLICEDFTDVLHTLKITLFHWVSNDRSVAQTSVIGITKTFYVLHFKDGEMMSCINLSYDLSMDLDIAMPEITQVDILFFDSLSPRTAVLINDHCFLIDQTSETILKHWVSVFKILDWTTQNGSTNLIVIFKTESYESLSNLTWDICDVDKIRPDSDDNVDEDVDAASDGDSTGLQSAKIALKAQLLKCQSAVKEAEANCQYKSNFIAETLQRLSKLQIGLDDADQNKSNMPPLVCVVEGEASSPYKHNSKSPEPDPSLSQPPLTVVESWCRVVSSHLVVAFDVRNTTANSIYNISMSVVCTSQCHPEMLHSVYPKGQNYFKRPGSAATESPGSATTKRMRVLSELQNSSGAINSSELGSRCDGTFTCCIQTSELVSANNVHLLVFVAYSQSESADRIEYFLQEIEMSESDLLSRFHVRSNGTVGVRDIQVLNCVQTCTAMSVTSVVSSVLCVTRALTACSSLLCVTCVDEYIFNDSSDLHLCRIKFVSQAARCHGTLELFTSSDQQLLLVVKYLYSLLPGDIKLTLSDDSETFRDTACDVATSVLSHVSTAVSDVGQKLSIVGEGIRSNSTEYRKAKDNRQKCPGSVEDGEEKMTEIDREREEIRKKRKRIRENLVHAD